MESTTERLEVRREIEIAASPETVWELLVDPGEADRAGGARARTFDPRPGRRRPDRGDARATSRAARSSRSTRRAGSSTPGAGRPAAAGRDAVPPGLEHGRDRARPRRRGHDAPASSIAACPTPRRSRATAHGWEHYLGAARRSSRPGAIRAGPWRPPGNSLETGPEQASRSIGGTTNEGRQRWGSTFTSTRAAAWPQTEEERQAPRWRPGAPGSAASASAIVDVGNPFGESASSRPTARTAPRPRGSPATRSSTAPSLDDAVAEDARLPDLRERRHVDVYETIEVM